MMGDPRRRGPIFEAQQERGKNLAVATYDRKWVDQSTLHLKQPRVYQQVQGKGIEE